MLETAGETVRVGIDLVEVKRMQKSMERPRFLTRAFSEQERKLMESRGRPAQTAAANFCAKEAFSKALGTGVRGFALAEVEVLRDALGKPYFVLHGSAKKLAEGWDFSLSLTHTEKYAAAVVIGTVAKPVKAGAGKIRARTNRQKRVRRIPVRRRITLEEEKKRP